MSDIEDEPPSVLLPCAICSRTFRPEVLDRHTKVCEKTASKKRRVFDSFKNRVSGTELEEFLGPAPLPGQVIKRPAKSPVKKKAPSKWKETHENLIAVLRAARGVQPPPDAVLEPPKQINEQCPSCNRFFGPRAFDRHVEFCKEKTARIKMTPSKVSQAQERLEARTKYRAPLSVKPKLTTKEKYSPMLPRKESSETCAIGSSSSSMKTSPPVPALTRAAKPSSSAASARSSLSRSTERQRSISPTKKNTVSSSKSTSKNESLTSRSSNQPRIKENLRDNHDILRSKTGSQNASQEKIRSSNLKLSKLTEDESSSKKSKSKEKAGDKTVPKSRCPSDDESVATVESESGETTHPQKRGTRKKSRWNSVENLSKTPRKGLKTASEDRSAVAEKTVVRLECDDSSAGSCPDRKSGKKTKKSARQQLNDLSVNDESFGIFVAPCGPGQSQTAEQGAGLTTSKSRKNSPDLSVMSRRNSPEKASRARQKTTTTPGPAKEKVALAHSDEETRHVKSSRKSTREKSATKKAEPVPSPKKDKVLAEDIVPTVRRHPDPPPAETKPVNRKVDKVMSSGIPTLKHDGGGGKYKKARYRASVPGKPPQEFVKVEESIPSKTELSAAEEEEEPESIPARKEDANAEVEDEKGAVAVPEEEDEEAQEDTVACKLDHLVDGTDDRKSEIRRKAKKWQNISEMSTEDLLRMSEDFDVPVEEGEEPQDLSDSAIWEIAAQQFLNADESVTSVDSLEPNAVKPREQPVPVRNEDDFIVLHVTDPTKMDESDATMKLSVSEPCFPNAGKLQKVRDMVKHQNLTVFAAFPTGLQRRSRRRRRYTRRCRRSAKASAPKMAQMREKTFLTIDLPKAKRRKLDEAEEKSRETLQCLTEKLFEGWSAEDFRERKRRFIEGLMSRPGTVTKWRVASNFHISFTESNRKSIEDDLKDLGNLTSGEKKRKKSYIKEFKREKLKEIKRQKVTGARKGSKKTVDTCSGNQGNGSVAGESPSDKDESGSGKKFAYFEICFDEEPEVKSPDKQKPERGPRGRDRRTGRRDEAPRTTPAPPPSQPQRKKPESFDVPENDDRPGSSTTTFSIRTDPLPFSTDRTRTSTPKATVADSFADVDAGTVHFKRDRNPELDKTIFRTYKTASLMNLAGADDQALTPADSIQTFNNPNSSLENIEEEDEEEEEEEEAEAETAAEVDEEGGEEEEKPPEDDRGDREDDQVPTREEDEEEEEEDKDEGDEDGEGKDGGHPINSSDEMKNFIMAKPNAVKLLSKEDNCLDQLFPKTRRVVGNVRQEESSTAIHLGYTADSVYDLKAKAETEAKELRRPAGRMLQKRVEKGTHLPQIKVKSEKQENSMMSLIELWKNKRGNQTDGDKVYKMRATLPTGKLAPLTNANSYQTSSNGNVDSYDPFKQAERQMLALLSWPSTTDVKTAKNISPKSKQSSPSPTSASSRHSNLETSPTSAFSKYKNEKSGAGTRLSGSTARKNLNETYETDDRVGGGKRAPGNNSSSNRQTKPTYTAADDWEQIFEKHFDLNRNEMTEQMTKSVRSALDGLLKSNFNRGPGGGDRDRDRVRVGSPDKSPGSLRNRATPLDESIITEILYTSTPKQNPRRRSRDGVTGGGDDVGMGTGGRGSRGGTQARTSDLTYARITPPQDFGDLLPSRPGTGGDQDRPNRHSGISLSNLSFCSDTTLADEEVMRSNLEIVGKAAAAAVSRGPRRKYARSQSVFEERNKMLFAKTYDPNVSSGSGSDPDGDDIGPDPNANSLPRLLDGKPGKARSPSRNSHPKSSHSHFYRSQSVFEDNKFKGDGDHTDEGEHISSPESNRNRKTKFSGDSAYSSLNRKSPQKAVQEDRLSSSGSEHSLTFANNEYNAGKPRVLDFDGSKRESSSSSSQHRHNHHHHNNNNNQQQQKESQQQQPVKMSKFCHECGSKYPVAVAKFCCQCGVRRLII